MEKKHNYFLISVFLNFLPSLSGEHLRFKITGATAVQNITSIKEHVIRFNLVKNFANLNFCAMIYLYNFCRAYIATLHLIVRLIRTATCAQCWTFPIHAQLLEKWKISAYFVILTPNLELVRMGFVLMVHHSTTPKIVIRNVAPILGVLILQKYFLVHLGLRKLDW